MFSASTVNLFVQGKRQFFSLQGTIFKYDLNDTKNYYWFIISFPVPEAPEGRRLRLLHQRRGR